MLYFETLHEDAIFSAVLVHLLLQVARTSEQQMLLGRLRYRARHCAWRPSARTQAGFFKITVCLRPFRAAGPRLDVERVGDKIVIHNYGHGGSGWSLSWGSSSLATEKALSTGEREFAVIGCGALGLTSATLLQRAGAKVTWLIPQPEVNYGVIYKDIVILGRRDGIVVQAHALKERMATMTRTSIRTAVRLKRQ